MDIREILSKCDHTVLDRRASLAQIVECLEDTERYGCASACIPPCFVRRAKELMGDTIKICTVIGFPAGYSTAAVKVYEAKQAIADGADEIDTVVNTTDVRDGKYREILEELRALRRATEGHVLKVIIETCLLNDEEKLELCRVVTESGADYIKTSTGFSTSGATPADVKLLREHVGEGVKVKAAGGISSLEDAEEMIKMGADRLGTSRIVKMIKKMEGFENGNDKDSAY